MVKYINVRQYDVIIHPFPDFNGDLNKFLFK